MIIKKKKPSTSLIIKQLAVEYGFDLCKITKPKLSKTIQKNLKTFIKKKFHGDMYWMENTFDRRKSPNDLWPEAKSAIVLGLNYGPKKNPIYKNKKLNFANISVYADGDDYHKVIKGKMKRFASKLFPILNKENKLDLKVFVDTAPLMEKPLAQLAGLGWQGKHTNLVSKIFGSWLFLGVILLNKEIEIDKPEKDHCGKCNACLKVCPTNAFNKPYEIDARKCISYLTIEYSGKIPNLLMEKIGNKVYGCDDCLSICPWNKFAKASSEIKFQQINKNLELSNLLNLSDEDFKKFFSKSAVKRIGRDKFIRNCCIAAGNSKNKKYLKKLKSLFNNEESDIIKHSSLWAINKLTN